MKRILIDNRRKNLGKLRSKKKFNLMRISSVYKELIRIRKDVFEAVFKQLMGNPLINKDSQINEIMKSLSKRLNLDQFKDDIKVRRDPADPNTLIWEVPVNMLPTKINSNLEG